MQIRCPACGVPCEVRSGRTFLACESCDARLVLYRGFGQRHLLLPPTLDEAAARNRLEVALESRRLPNRPRDLEVVGELFPCWRIEEGARTRVEAARATEHPALSRIGLATGEARSFDEALARGFATLPPTLPPPSTPGTRVDLVHVPVWRLHFRLGGEPCEVLIDALRGAELAFRGPPPGTDPRRLVREMVACLAAYTLLFVILPGMVALGSGLALALWLASGPSFLEELR